MTNLIEGNSSVKIEQIRLVITLIMLKEHKKLSLDEILHTTGMDFNEARTALQTLVNLQLIEVIPRSNGIPEFKLENDYEVNKFLKISGVLKNE